MATDPTDLLTDRQRDVYRLAAEGKAASEIAEALGVSTNNIHTHLRTLRSRRVLDKNNRPTKRVAAEAAEPAPQGNGSAPAGDVGVSVIEADIIEHVPALREARQEIDERLKTLEQERERLRALRDVMPTPA